MSLDLNIYPFYDTKERVQFSIFVPITKPHTITL